METSSPALQARAFPVAEQKAPRTVPAVLYERSSQRILRSTASRVKSRMGRSAAAPPLATLRRGPDLYTDAKASDQEEIVGAHNVSNTAVQLPCIILYTNMTC